MAAPHVAGAIALMFQANKDLTQAAILAHLQASARSDVHTGAVPNADWGAGKMDVQAAVNRIPSPDVPPSEAVAGVRARGRSRRRAAAPGRKRVAARKRKTAPA